MPDFDTTRSSSFQPGLRDDIDLGGQAGLATYVAAKIYGSVPLPPGMPDWLKGSIESQANFAQRLPSADAMTIGGAGGGPVDPKTKKERQRDADAESIDDLTGRLEQADRECARNEWAQQVHGFAGVEMSGAEWHDLSTELKRNGELREWLVSRLMRDGKSRNQAEGKADEIADVAGIMAKPEGERTDAERKKLDRAENDPELKKYIEAVDAKRREMSAPESAQARTIQDASMRESSAARADMLGSAATSIATAHFQIATSSPADRPAPQTALIAKPPSASATASGFDM